MKFLFIFYFTYDGFVWIATWFYFNLSWIRSHIRKSRSSILYEFDFFCFFVETSSCLCIFILYFFKLSFSSCLIATYYVGAINVLIIFGVMFMNGSDYYQYFCGLFIYFLFFKRIKILPRVKLMLCYVAVTVWCMLRLWQVYQVAQVVTGKTGISFPKRIVYTK